MKTIDRAEIENFSSIRELIAEFLADPSPQRPLCFAVFGPPGSGKSYGVKQVAKSVAGAEIDMLMFNIAQFHGYDDLAAALQKVRNIALAGRIPFVFFDEFDCSCDGAPLGWLQYFLTPMQDGEFRDRGDVHQVGKAVFVFAGGTRSSFTDFEQNTPDGMAHRDGTRFDEHAATLAFREAKGPDFVSRLRGYINIMGPNRQHPRDYAFVIRRAMLLRSLLKRHHAAQGLFDDSEELQIDRGVLRALLCVSKYRHGTRSMTAIFDMSQIAGQSRFDVSALPPRHLMNIHVDAEEFLMVAQRERYQSMLSMWGPRVFTLQLEKRAGELGDSYRSKEDLIVNAVAELIHEAYCRSQKGTESKHGRAYYADLSKEQQEANIDAAQDIPSKLRSVGCGLRIPLGSSPATFSFEEDELENLTQQEHERWCRVKRLQGYRYGKKGGMEGKANPALLPYNHPGLSDEAKKKDREAVGEIPDILLKLGYEIYRMDDGES